MKLFYIFLFSIIIFTGCAKNFGGESGLFGSFTGIDSPASSPSGQPFLFADKDGIVYMSWIEPGNANKHAFRFAIFENDRWSEPRTISEGDEFFVNWADVPSIFKSEDGTLAAHWLVSSNDWIFAYDVHTSISPDGGDSWSEPVAPHRDGTKTEHGFAAFFNHPDGGIGFAWLDGREAEYTGAAGNGHSQNAEWNMHLRSTVIQSSGQPGDEIVLDNKVCECCPTAVTETSDEVLIAYRNRTDEEIRDIYLVRYANGEWSEPYPVHNDGWNIPGCPVNGPSLSSDNDNVAIAWYTAGENDPRVYIAFSENGGETFDSPYRISGDIPLGRVSVEMLDDHSALVLWIEVTEEAAGLMVRRIFPDGTMTPTEKIARISEDRSSGYPRIARSGDKIMFAWVDTFNKHTLRTAVARLRE